MHESTSRITSARKLEALAKKHPEVAALLAASKPVEIPVKTQDEPNPLLTEK